MSSTTYRIKVSGKGHLEGLAIGGRLIPIDRPFLDPFALQHLAAPSFGPLAWSTRYREVAQSISSILNGMGHEATVEEDAR